MQLGWIKQAWLHMQKYRRLVLQVDYTFEYLYSFGRYHICGLFTEQFCSERGIFSNAETENWFIDSFEEWRKAKNLSNFILLGHSFGGYVTAKYALKVINFHRTQFFRKNKKFIEMWNYSLIYMVMYILLLIKRFYFSCSILSMFSSWFW